MMTVNNLRGKLLSLLRRSSIGRFSKNVASTFAVQIVSLLLIVANAAVLARWLGPEGKGIVALALLVPGLLGLFLGGGMTAANVYFASSGRLDVSTLVANSLAVVLVTTILGFVLIGLAAATGVLESLVPGVPRRLLLLAGMGFPLGLLNSHFSSILQGLQRIVAINAVSFARSLLLLTLGLLLVVGLKMDVLGAVLASLGATAGSAAALGVLLRREGVVFVPRWNGHTIRSMLSFAVRGHIGNILQFFSYRLDMFMVNYFIDPAGVGTYTVAVRLAELLWYLPNAVSFVIFPKAATTDSEVMNVFTPRVFRVTLGLTALGSLGLAVFGNPIIRLIYSSTFADAYFPMLALLPGVVFLGGAKVLTNEIAGRGYPHYNSITSGSALILTIVLDLLMIPRYGVLGASLASTVAYIAVFLISIVFYRIVAHKAGSTPAF